MLKHCDFCKLVKGHTANCICACHTAKEDVAQIEDPKPQFQIETTPEEFGQIVDELSGDSV